MAPTCTGFSATSPAHNEAMVGIEDCRSLEVLLVRVDEIDRTALRSVATDASTHQD